MREEYPNRLRKMARPMCECGGSLVIGRSKRRRDGAGNNRWARYKRMPGHDLCDKCYKMMLNKLRNMGG